MWWRMFDRAAALPEERRDDPGCIEGLEADGDCVTEKKSLVQAYRFDPAQECKLAAGDAIRFVDNLDVGYTIAAIDATAGRVTLKIGKKTLDESSHGKFPHRGAILAYEYVNPAPIPEALTAVATGTCRTGCIRRWLRSWNAGRLLRPCRSRTNPRSTPRSALPGNVRRLPRDPRSAWHRQNLCGFARHRGAHRGREDHRHRIQQSQGCDEFARWHAGRRQRNPARSCAGIKVGGDGDDEFFKTNESIKHVPGSSDARARYEEASSEAPPGSSAGPTGKGRSIISSSMKRGRSRWPTPLRWRAAPGISSCSAIRCSSNTRSKARIQATQDCQYCNTRSRTYKRAQPTCRSSMPSCRRTTDSFSANRGACILRSAASSPRASTKAASCPIRTVPASGSPSAGPLVRQENGIVFSPVEHDGNIQQSDEEVARVKAIYHELLGRPYRDKDGKERPLALDDFLFIAPYNAQVRALKAALPEGARVGSVDKFQGQEAPSASCRFVPVTANTARGASPSSSTATG